MRAPPRIFSILSMKNAAMSRRRVRSRHKLARPRLLPACLTQICFKAFLELFPALLLRVCAACTAARSCSIAASVLSCSRSASSSLLGFLHRGFPLRSGLRGSSLFLLSLPFAALLFFLQRRSGARSAVSSIFWALAGLAFASRSLPSRTGASESRSKKLLSRMNQM